MDPNLCYVAAGVVLVFLIGFLTGSYVQRHDDEKRHEALLLARGEHEALTNEAMWAIAEVERFLQVARDGEEREA